MLHTWSLQNRIVIILIDSIRHNFASEKRKENEKNDKTKRNYCIFLFFKFSNHLRKRSFNSLLVLGLYFFLFFHSTHLLLKFNFRIQNRIEDIDNQVDDDKLQRKDQNQGLDCRIISVIDRFNQKGAKARIGKYRFCDNRTSQQKAELQTHNRHDGDHGVAENMLPDHNLFFDSFCSCCSDVIFF